MPIREKAALKYFYFENLEGHGVVQGIFTRHGGVSPTPWSSLNLGGTIGDTRENVIENRRRIFELMGREVESIFDVWQVHGVDVICTDQPRPLDGLHAKADAILTNNPEITLFMRFADCVPVFLMDPVKKVVGLVHAGWQGTVQRICEKTVRTMQEVYGSKPLDILAGIGPSIGPESYEVGEDVLLRVQEGFGDDELRLIKRYNGCAYLDLWESNRLTLESVGVRQIELAKICTVQNNDDWYSHRKEKGKTGRFGALLALK